MIYLYILFSGVVVLYTAEHKKFSKKSIDFVILFVTLLMVFFSAQQYAVGTDYFSYLYGFEDGQHYRFYNKSEYVYYYFYIVVDWLNLNPQFIFFLSSALNGIAFFFILKKLQGMGYSLWMVFFIFFTFTGFYHNQMNGLRQYTAIIFFNLLLVLLAYKGIWLQKLFALTIGVFSHLTFYIGLFFIPFIVLLKKYKGFGFNFAYLYIFTTFFYLLSPGFMEFIVSAIAPHYSFYFKNSYAQGTPLTSILTKLIYFPFFIWFLFLYARDNDFNREFRKRHFGFDYFVLIWSLTSMMYIATLSFGFVFRVSQYFIFFNIFPIYYLIYVFLKTKQYLFFYILFSSLFFAYVFKVLLFPVREYSFSSFIFS